MQTVIPQVQVEHELQMPSGHVEILRIARQPTGLHQNRGPHEHRVAHLAVKGHRRQQLPLLVKAEACGDLRQLDKSSSQSRRESVSSSQFAKDQVPGDRAATGPLSQ